MSKTLTKPRVSRDQWLARALQVLETEGLQGVRVDRLARDFGISRAGIYWHFRGRQDLLQAMLDFWAEEFTVVITADPELQQGDPGKRLERIAELILERNLARYDLAILDLSAHDKSAARVLRKVYRMRLEFIRSLFQAAGFR